MIGYGRVCYIIYGLVSLTIFVSSYNMPGDLEDYEVEEKPFFEKFTSDFKLVCLTLRAKAVYMYISFLILVGIMPNFGSAAYMQMKLVYKIN